MFGKYTVYRGGEADFDLLERGGGERLIRVLGGERRGYAAINNAACVRTKSTINDVCKQNLTF